MQCMDSEKRTDYAERFLKEKCSKFRTTVERFHVLDNCEVSRDGNDAVESMSCKRATSCRSGLHKEQGIKIWGRSKLFWRSETECPWNKWVGGVSLHRIPWQTEE